MSGTRVDRVLVALQMHRVRCLAVLAVVVAAVVVTTVASMRSSDPSDGETNTPMTTTVSLEERFCTEVETLDSLSQRLNTESWRTAPLGLEEVYRRWEADKSREQYIPDAVFVFAYDVCGIEDSAEALRLARMTPHASAVTYAGRDLSALYLIPAIRQSFEAATPAEEVVAVMAAAVVQLGRSGKLPVGVALSFVDRNDDTARFDVSVPQVGFESAGFLCVKITVKPADVPDGIGLIPTFGPGPCGLNVRWPIPLAP